VTTDPHAVPLEERVRLFVEALTRIAASARDSVNAAAPELPMYRLQNVARADAYERAVQLAAEMLGLTVGRGFKRTVSCHDLTEDTREAVEDWFRRHDVDLRDVPSTATVEYFPAADEWGIEQFVRNDDGDLPGRPSQTPMTTTVRRPNRGPFPGMEAFQ
jgi:hypothetical protein